MKLSKKIFILLSLMVTIVKGADLAELYMQGKTEDLFRYIDNQLATEDYWEEKLGDNDYKFGYYTDEKDILIACKECNRLRHFKVKKDYQLALKDLNATFGKYSGDKEKEGDRRTPIGVYTFTKKLDGSKGLDPFYGPVAFVTDYPNLLDQKMHKNGSGIWLHGFPLQGDRDPKTKGCIALENDCLEDIAGEMDFTRTILLINESHENLAKKDELVAVLTALFKWRKYWVENDYDKYISYYGEDFRRIDGLGLKKFKELKKEIFSNNKYIDLYFDNLEVTPYPNSYGKRIYKVKFFEKYKSNQHHFDGYKELYTQLVDNQIKIILES